ncbi:MAG: DUF1595 domain-containing protein [Bryobacteraceae bacterium]
MPPGGAKGGKRQASTAFLKAVAEPVVAGPARLLRGRPCKAPESIRDENSLRDLLAAPWLQVRSSLPEDGIVNRFNKVGQALDVSHVQMARYIETAEQALRLTLAASREPEKSQRYYARDQKKFLNRMRFSPFNRSPERATIPILGFEAQPDVLAEKVPITVGEKDPKTRDLEAFATPASTYTGNEYHFDQFTAPAGGTYHLRFNAYSLWIHTLFGPEGKPDQWWRPNREKTSRGRTTEPVTIYALSRGGEKRLLGSFDVTPEPGLHDLVVHLLSGEQILPDASRLFRSRPGWVGNPLSSEAGTPGVAYRWMEVKGPVANSASRDRLLSSDPKDAERLLSRFMTEAYRRPPEQAEKQRYLKIVNDQFKRSGDFPESMISGYTAVLCSPGFLYLEETPGALSSRELAARLSYFLWNAPPDAELKALAAKDQLRRPEAGADGQALAGSKSRHFIDAFLDYWPDLRKLTRRLRTWSSTRSITLTICSPSQLWPKLKCFSATWCARICQLVTLSIPVSPCSTPIWRATTVCHRWRA